MDDISPNDLTDEYSSRPSVAQWIWCIEYVAKSRRDIRYIRDIMNVDLQCPNDLGKRTSEVVALRILEFLFRPSEKNANNVCAPSTSESRVEFDLSLSTFDVLQTIIKEIPLSDLRPGMAELSKFNVFPFIAHKNSCLPSSALERLRDAVSKENRTNATPFRKASESVLADKQPRHMDEQPMHVNKEDEVIVIDDDSEDDEGDQGAMFVPVNKGNTHVNPLSSPPKRQDDACVKCGKVGDLLICSNHDCSAMVHEECLNCPVWLDEKGNFRCPQCWYHQATSEYLESKKSIRAARVKLVEFLGKLAAVNKRFRDLEHPPTSA